MLNIIFKIKLFIIFAAIIFSIPGFAQNWQLVWSDEFDGSVLDGNNWTREIGGHGWGNNELEYYTSRDTNAFIENGHLVIQALKENYSNRSYTSARLKTQDKKYFKYGKIEASIKLPYGQGLWPAFWMLGQNFPAVGWPACGEIDIMEMIGGQGRENTVHGTVHWDNNGQHAQYGGSYTLVSGIFADDFHIFSITWDPQEIKWYVDGIFFHVIDITPQLLSEFQQDFFLILNVAVGGNWPGNPDATTVFPQRMEVDYVRVYQDIPVNVGDEVSNPLEFELNQNYPNPFNPETIITYSIPYNSHVSIIVYNALGEKVAELVDEVKENGYHKVEWNAIDFPGGIYFYRLKAGDFVKTKKMILLR